MTGAGPGVLEEITAGVFAYIQPDGSWFVNNTGFIPGDDGVLSIDSCATEARTRAYLTAIRTVTTRPVTTLVNTHHHRDHTNGNALLGATAIIAHARCRDQLARAPWPPPVPLFGPVDWGRVGTPRVWWRLDSPQMLWSGWPLSSTVPPPGGTTV